MGTSNTSDVGGYVDVSGLNIDIVWRVLPYLHVNIPFCRFWKRV